MSHVPDPDRRRWLMVAGAAAATSLSGCATPPGSVSPSTRESTTASTTASITPPSAGAVRTSAGLTSGALASPDESLALHLLNRLAYGPAPGEIAALMRQGGHEWIERQLQPAGIEQPQPLVDALAARPTLASPHAPTLARFAQLQADVLSSRLTQAERDAARPQLTRLIQQVQREAREARLMRAVASHRQLEEVLVEFWFNHFNVFGGKESVRVTAGYFESEAIRPHVLGRFRDLLGATARHPAMLNYLDNWTSVRNGFALPAGLPLPDGFVPPRGLNENYARELLELHTLGVQGGYTQSDVTELARIFTGWSFDRRNPGPRDAFRFYPARHDDGPKRLLGQTVPGRGLRQGEWALDVLARHPATARHISHKLALAFVADAPPESLVRTLSQVFLDTDGDLREVMRALIRSPEFLDPAIRGAKFKPPFRHVASAARACALPLDEVARMVPTVGRMGMPIHLCPTPDGWRDTREAWLSPEALRQRVALGADLARVLQQADRPTGERAGAAMMRVSWRGEVAVPPSPLSEALWAQLSPVTRGVIDELPASQRLAIALASPDFMRR